MKKYLASALVITATAILGGCAVYPDSYSSGVTYGTNDLYINSGPVYTPIYTQPIYTTPYIVPRYYKDSPGYRHDRNYQQPHFNRPPPRRDLGNAPVPRPQMNTPTPNLSTNPPVQPDNIGRPQRPNNQADRPQRERRD